MLSIIFYVFGSVVLLIGSNMLQIENVSDQRLAVIVALMIIFIWGAGLLAAIQAFIKEHLEKIEDIKATGKNKQASIKEMKIYKEEMKKYLLETYPQYKERLIKGITDSQILTTIIEKESYSKVVIDYNNKIKCLLSEIGDHERARNRRISEVMAAQNDTWGWACFIPKRMRYEEID